MTVRYDPEDPADSALEAGFDKAVELSIAGVVLIAICMLGFRFTRKPPPDEPTG